MTVRPVINCKIALLVGSGRSRLSGPCLLCCRAKIKTSHEKEHAKIRNTTFVLQFLYCETFFIFKNGVIMSASDYITDEQALELVRKLSPANRLVCEIMYVTGMRVGDVCALKRGDIERAMQTGFITVTEQKTGKKRSAKADRKLLEKALVLAGEENVFPNQRDKRRHRTRNAVWNQVRKQAHQPGLTITPHSFRKNYAVRKFRETGDIEKVRRMMGHDNISTTILYVTSDIITNAKKEGQKGDKDD